MSNSLSPHLSTLPFPPSPHPKKTLPLPQSQQHSKHPPTLQLSQSQSQEIPTQKPTIRSRLSQLCKDGRLDVARRLFDSLPRPAPTLLWNTLLIGYVCNAMPAEALRLYTLMNKGSPCPQSDAYTYSSALKACADTRQLNLGKSIHCHIIRHSPALPKNRVLNNSLLNMYASCLEFPCYDAVRSLFDRMPKRNVVAWNTMIAWYVRSRRPAVAVGQFTRMIAVGVRPTTVSFINVFPAVAGLKDKKFSDLVYGMLIKYGAEYVNDVFVVSSAIFMYSELSDIRSARWVFNLAEKKNIEVWNTMIGGYFQNDWYVEAVELFIENLESEEVDADAVTFLTSLMAVSQLQEVRLGQQIHAHLITGRSKVAVPLYVYNALIVMYSRCGHVQLAFDLFHQMPERDIITWNTMISAFVQKDCNLEGLLLVYEMQKQGFAADSVTLTALLSAASNLRSLRIGRETHGYLIRHQIHCEGMESYLIDMYSKSGRVETAWQLFYGDRSDERDQVTWNAMIAGYTQNGRAEEALSLFRKMITQENQMPNSVTLSSILPACDPVGGIQAGKQIHGFAVRCSLDKNVFVGTALVDMYSRCGEITSAERVFDGMEEKNTVSYTTMLSGFGQHGFGQRALSLFKVMQESGAKPDAVTFVAVLSACSYSGLVDEGLAVFQSMKEYEIVATPEHYCCVVDLLGRAGRAEEAYEFVQSLGDDANTVGIWGSLLGACRVHQKFELGKLVSERLFELEKANDDAGYRVLLSNVYAAEGKWEKVDRVRKEMREGGLRKEPGSSWIEVGDASHRFMSRDQKHPQSDQIYAMLEELALEMRLSEPKPIVASLVHGILAVEQNLIPDEDDVID